METQYRALPSVDRVLSDVRVRRLVADYSHEPVLELVREQIDTARNAILEGRPAPDFDEMVTAIKQRAESQWRSWPRPVINATGVVLHTNLGRAPLSQDALEAVARASGSYSDLEMDIESGRRGSRHGYVSGMICRLTGAEAALVINNNASAVLLGLTAVAGGREVIVSRGEAVEIGGGFRVPDVMHQSGATLVDVGTTNRTYVRDYEAAISERTGAILVAHTSNFRVSGFTASPAMRELVELGRSRAVPVLHDLGSGCLMDTAPFGLAHEPTPQESIAAGVSLVFFSGDKLLGGPQAGIVVGEAALVEWLSRHPLARAVRPDKLCLAALSATLLHYVSDEAIQKVPVWRMIALPPEEIESRAHRWEAALGEAASVVAGLSAIGGGSLPGETLPTSLLSLDAGGLPGGAASLAEAMRRGKPPVVARIENEHVLLDPRTVSAEEEEPLLSVVRDALDGVRGR